jgi:hypothetical protein
VVFTHGQILCVRDSTGGLTRIIADNNILRINRLQYGSGLYPKYKYFNKTFAIVTADEAMLAFPGSNVYRKLRNSPFAL